MDYEIAWAVFLGSATLTFGVLEWGALRAREDGKPSGTLTAVLRRWLGLDPAHWRRWPLGVVLAGGLGVFALHILTAWV